MPGSVLSANTKGENVCWTIALMSTPITKRINQNTSTRKNNGLSDRNDSYTTGGTLSGSLMTRLLSVKNFCTTATEP